MSLLTRNANYSRSGQKYINIIYEYDKELFYVIILFQTFS